MKIMRRSGIDYTRTLRVRKIINDANNKANNKNRDTNMEQTPPFSKEDSIILRLLEIYCDWQVEASDPDLPEPVLEVLTHCRQDFLNCVKSSCIYYGAHSHLSIYLNKLAETLFNTKNNLLGLTSVLPQIREQLAIISEICDFSTERVLEMAEEIESDEKEKEAAFKEIGF